MPDATPIDNHQQAPRKRKPLVIPEQRPAKLVKATATLSAKEKERKDEALKASYSYSQQTLREKYLGEFNEIRIDAMARLGFEWTPPQTEKEKAKAEFERLLALNPDFANLVQQNEEAEDAAALADDEGPEAGEPEPDDPTAPGMRNVG